MKTVTTLFVYVILVKYVECSKILSIFNTPSKSHSLLGFKLAEGLIRRGHHVTMLSTFSNAPMENYTHIHLESLLKYRELQKKETPSKEKNSIFRISNYVLEMSEIFWKDPAIEKIIKEKPIFDVIIMVSFFNDGALGIGHHLGVPVIMFNPIGSTSLANGYVGNPNMAYVPNPLITRSTDSFLGRLLAVTMNGVMSSLIRLLLDSSQQGIMRKYLPNSPPLSDLQSNISLMLVNSHFSVEPPRPYVPNMIPIGGFHLDKTNILPLDLKNWLDSAEKGAILFSLGTSISFTYIDVKKREGILKVLGELAPMKVLLKSEIEVEDMPSNILVKKWLPQAEILAHPNIKVLICHGGLNSNTESVFYGVPILGIPFFGDQLMNMDEAQKAGYAILLQNDNITEQTFRSKVKEIITNPRYTLNAKRRSAFMREYPVKPMDNAVFWIEHIIKFGGGSHLKNVGMNLTWYQFYMLDIFCFYAACIILLLVTSFYSIKFSIRIFKKCIDRQFSKNKDLKSKIS